MNENVTVEMNENLTVEMNKIETDLTVYPMDDVLVAATEYFNGDVLAGEVWMKKYALKDVAGNIYEKTPADMHRRLASEFARVESK